MIPRIFRWDDGNAPVLNGVAGSLINLLSKCLVEGYGDKLPAGWTLEYANIELTKAAFRNNIAAGNGFFLHIDDTATTSAVAKGFEAMVDIDTGNALFGTSRTILKSNAAGTSIRRWVLVATDTIFYLFTFFTAGGGWTKPTSIPAESHYRACALFFGDFYPAIEEGYNTVLAAGGCDPSATNATTGGRFTDLLAPPSSYASGVSVSIFAARNILGTPNTAAPLKLLSPGGPTAFVATSYGHAATGPLYTPGRIFISPVLLAEGPAQGGLRGRLPGLYYPCHDLFNNPPDIYQTIIEEDREFLLVNMHCAASFAWPTRYSSLSMIIDVSVDWSLSSWS